MNTYIMREGGVIQNYVAGFLFDKYRHNVLLIDKLKPEWQKGLMNGVGGKIEYPETPMEAMIREFKEETGLTISGSWREFAKVRWLKATVYFFTAVYPYDLSDAKSITEESLVIVPVSTLPARVVPNLKWLIPMAADLDEYHGDILGSDLL